MVNELRLKLSKEEASYNFSTERIKNAETALKTSNSLFRSLKETRMEMQKKVESNNEWLEKEIEETERLNLILTDINEDTKEKEQSISIFKEKQNVLQNKIKAYEVNLSQYRCEVKDLTLEDEQQEKIYQGLLKKAKEGNKIVQNLEATLQSLNREKEEKISTVESLQKRNDAANEDIENVHHKLDQELSERNYLLKQWEAAFLQCEIVDADLCNYEQVLTAKKEEAGVKKAETSQKEKELEISQEKLKKAKQRRNKSIAELDEAKLKLQEQNNILMQLENEKRLNVSQEKMKKAKQRRNKSIAELDEAKLKLQEQNNILMQLENEKRLNVSKIDNVKNEIKSLDAEKVQTGNDIKQVQRKIQLALLKEESLKESLKNIEEHGRSTEEMVKDVQKLVKEEEKHIESIQGSIEALNVAKSRMVSQLSDLESRTKQVSLEISCAKKSKERITKENNKIRQMNESLEEAIYKASFELLIATQSLERLMETDAESSEKHEQWRVRIDSLNEDIKEKKRILLILRQELLTSQAHVMHQLRMYENEQRSCKTMMEEEERLRSLDAALKSQMKEQDKDIYKKQLEIGLLKLHIQHKQKLLTAKSKRVLNIEQRKRNLEEIIEKRSTELKNEEKRLKCEIKVAKEELSKFRNLENLKISQTNKLIARYELVMKSITSGEEENIPQSEIKSEAYCIIKLAQEKEEVRQCLLNLENEVDELKNNLRALKNTADLVQASNSSYRAIAVRGTLSEEWKEEEEQKLQEKLKLERLLKTRQGGIETLKANIMKLETEMIQLEAKNVEIVKEVEILRQKEKHCQFELANYKGKIGRTMMLIEKIRTEIRKKCRTHSKTEQEMLVECQELRLKQMEAQELLSKMSKETSSVQSEPLENGTTCLNGITTMTSEGLMLDLETGRVSLSVDLGPLGMMSDNKHDS
ncbi:coiled-coil domain-containing protein 39-like isoform X3 [Artemia franciscana]|uniref:coiled-coil domain-containing protein 39-like isoform X2 n=1 Tax=Artemia franciscana TaxID=6661 RepID=UPI0032DA5870